MDHNPIHISEKDVIRFYLKKITDHSECPKIQNNFGELSEVPMALAIKWFLKKPMWVK